MFTDPDTIYAVRRSQMQDQLVEAEQYRLARQAVPHQPRSFAFSRLRWTAGAWLVWLGRHLEGRSVTQATPATGTPTT